jgi:hypothetical protein
MNWAIEVQKPRILSETLAELDSFLYSTIGRMLLTLLTMPVSTAVFERSFSAMRRIKTYLRSTMENERLSSIDILHIHWSKRVNIEGIIDEFAGAANRRLAFVFNDDSYTFPD